MARAALNGTELYCELHGGGPPLLTLHGGLGFDHVYMKATLGPLERTHTVIYYDHRGNGRSDRSAVATITMEQLADDAAALLRHVGHDRAIVFGHSYGGFIAQEMALRHPDRIAGLVLVDTTPGQLGSNEAEDETEQGPPPPPEMLEAMSALPASDQDFEDSLDTMLPFYLHSRTPEELHPLIAGTEVSVAAMARGFEVLSQWSSVDRLAQIAAPTLVMCGRHDLLTSAPQSTRIAKRIPGAKVVYFENSGHFPWFEEPDAFFAAFADWASAHDLV